MFPCYSASCSSALNPLPASRFLVPVPASRHSYFCLARPSVSYFPLPTSRPRLPPFLFPLGSALLPASRPLLCSSFLASSLSPACSLPCYHIIPATHVIPSYPANEYLWLTALRPMITWRQIVCQTTSPFLCFGTQRIWTSCFDLQETKHLFSRYLSPKL